MRETIKEYGAAVIAAVAVVMVLGVLFVLPRVESGEETEAPQAGEQAMEDLMEREPPQVTAAKLREGQAYSLGEVFTALDRDGNAAEVTVYGITDSKGEDVTMDVYQREDNRFCFEKRGRYAVTVKVSDDMGAFRECRVALYVVRPEETGVVS